MGKKNKKKKQGNSKQSLNRAAKDKSISTEVKKNNQEISYKKKWYKSDKIIDIAFSILIAWMFFELSLIESTKSTEHIISTSNKNTDTILSSQAILHDAIKNLKDNSEEVKSLLKQPKTPEEYESFKKQQLIRFEELKKENEEYLKEKIDSLFNEAKIIVNSINYINSSRWTEVFNAGYFLFTIGLENKLYRYAGSFQSNLNVYWRNIAVEEINNEVITIHLPKLHDTERHIIINSSFALKIDRKLEDLNKIFSYGFPGTGIGIYAGIISDNENGLIVLLGFGDGSRFNENEQLINFNELQKITQIDFQSKNDL